MDPTDLGVPATFFSPSPLFANRDPPAAPNSLKIQRAAHGQPAALENVGVDPLSKTQAHANFPRHIVRRHLMDTIAIATIASATVSLLVPYLKSLGEELTKKAGGEIGAKVGEAAWIKAKQLYGTVKAKFASNPNTAKVISALEKSPDDEDTQAAVRFHLEAMMASDEGFAKELANLLKEASEAGADTIFQTTIMGNVQKLVQMGNVYGDVKI